MLVTPASPPEKSAATLPEPSCREVQNRLGELLSGALDAQNAQHFRWHMAACEFCRKKMREQRRAVQHLLGRPPDTDVRDTQE